MTTPRILPWSYQQDSSGNVYTREWPGRVVTCWQRRVNLPHDPLRPLNRRRNQRLGARTRTVVEQILGGPEVPGDQNASDDAEHALPALVHGERW
jgi:hypothetical protein